jgi:hypothetical protein
MQTDLALPAIIEAEGFCIVHRSVAPDGRANKRPIHMRRLRVKKTIKTCGISALVLGSLLAASQAFAHGYVS